MRLDERRRIQNERKFETWENRPGGGRRYRYEVRGRHGWLAVYVKEVDDDEITVNFRQEIYNDRGRLVEIHEKYPIDKGHQRVLEKGDTT